MRARSKYRWIGVGLVLACLWPAAARAQTDEVVYFYTDAVGSVRMTTDGAGTVLARYDFHPFGGDAVPPMPPTPDMMQFAGKLRDVETGLSYFGARSYAGQAGRFTTVDPVPDQGAALLDPQRWNRYAYARNNPLRYVDPDGRDPRVVGAVVGAAVYAGWNAYANIQQGRRWYENIGVEASKGLLVGVTLGLAAPAVAGTTVADMGVLAAPGGADVAVRAAREGASALGRGSTANLSKGTTLARNLREQLAIDQAMGSAAQGTRLRITMTDPRWPASEGWVKMQQIIKPGGQPINVHYLFNEATGAVDDFKIVLPGLR